MSKKRADEESERTLAVSPRIGAAFAVFDEPTERKLGRRVGQLTDLLVLDALAGESYLGRRSGGLTSFASSRAFSRTTLRTSIFPVSMAVFAPGDTDTATPSAA